MPATPICSRYNRWCPSRRLQRMSLALPLAHPPRPWLTAPFRAAQPLLCTRPPSHRREPRLQQLLQPTLRLRIVLVAPNMVVAPGGVRGQRTPCPCSKSYACAGCSRLNLGSPSPILIASSQPMLQREIGSSLGQSSSVVDRSLSSAAAAMVSPADNGAAYETYNVRSFLRGLSQRSFHPAAARPQPSRRPEWEGGRGGRRMSRASSTCLRR